jgi:cytochrome P450
MDEIANAIPIRVVSRLIGFHAEDPDLLLAAAFASTAMLAATGSRDEMFACMERTAEVSVWIDEQLRHAVAEGAGGILGVIAEAVGRGDLGHADGLVITQTLLSAGGESTTSLLGNATHMLAAMPDLQAQVRATPELVFPFIEETLRLESPFRFHMRHVMRDTELCGVPIPAGATMLLFWGAANRDPAEYDRPDDVVLDRPTSRHHVGFGRGIHHCVGAALARLEAEVVLTRFLERTTSFALDPDAPPERVNSLMVRRFEALPLRASRA